MTCEEGFQNLLKFYLSFGASLKSFIKEKMEKQQEEGILRQNVGMPFEDREMF